MAKEAVITANQLADHGKRDLVITLMEATAGKLLRGDAYEQVVQAFLKGTIFKRVF